MVVWIDTGWFWHVLAMRLACRWFQVLWFLLGNTVSDSSDLAGEASPASPEAAELQQTLELEVNLEFGARHEDLTMLCYDVCFCVLMATYILCTCWILINLIHKYGWS